MKAKIFCTFAGVMKKISLLLLLLAALVSCSTAPAQEETGTLPLSGEEWRLQKAAYIDSVTIPLLLSPETIRGHEALDSLTAEAWILVDDSLGLVLSAKNADLRMYPASLTKMMTCLLTLEHGEMGDSIEITPDVCVTRDTRVKAGDRYLEGHLLREMMLVSDNVSACALAKHVGGDTLAFISMMNQKAAAIGMSHTHFANPNGMPNDSNYSTARDLLTLARYAMGDAAFADIVGTDSMDVPLLDGRHLPCRNTNALLRSYDGCFGVKTGYTRKAGSCLAAAATRRGITLYLVLLKSGSNARRFTESAILLDYGFQVMEALHDWQRSKFQFSWLRHASASSGAEI